MLCVLQFFMFNFQTTPLSSMDQWICSRLYNTVLQCEQTFPTYELHGVTSALYSFWVHSLCDVYLVRSTAFVYLLFNYKHTFPTLLICSATSKKIYSLSLVCSLLRSLFDSYYSIFQPYPTFHHYSKSDASSSLSLSCFGHDPEHMLSNGW